MTFSTNIYLLVGYPVRRMAAWVVIILLGLFVTMVLPAPAAPLSEYELKAVFLLNFARFSEWPKSALADGSEPLVIGVLGADPFGKTLDATVQGELIGTHPLAVRRFSRDQDFSKCHLLFIGKSETSRLTAILSSLRGKPVLTVSDIDRFVYQSGMIGMFIEQGRVRVQVNFDRTSNEHVTISAKLLKVSSVIREAQPTSLRSKPPTVGPTASHAPKLFLPACATDKKQPPC